MDDETARLEREFNRYGEVERQTLSVAGNAVGEVALTRDDVGRITAKTETIDGAAYEYAYEYDDFGRLTVVRDGAGSELERYTYGPQGERLTETNVLRGIVSRSFTYDDEDRLLTAGGAEYEFDADGFLTSKTDGAETTTYDYSSRGELKKVELPDGKVVEYLHDPLGRRVAKLVNGVVVEKYLWAGRTTLLAVYNGDDTLKSRFLYADPVCLWAWSRMAQHTTSPTTRLDRCARLLTNREQSSKLCATILSVTSSRTPTPT